MNLSQQIKMSKYHDYFLYKSEVMNMLTFCFSFFILFVYRYILDFFKSTGKGRYDLL